MLTIDPAVLQTIVLTPAGPSIAKGVTDPFTATGTFSDGSTQDLTGQVTWTSATTFVASISTAGVATGLTPGVSTITAALGGVTGQTVLTVGPAVLQSIAVTPASPSIPKGESEQFIATGTLSDNSTEDLTSQVIWTSTTTTVATITTTGLASGLVPGTTTITAALGGVTARAVLTVSPAVLQSIAVTPANPSVAKGETEPLAAAGIFSDGSTQNLTTQVTWVSANPSVATVTAAGLASGLVPGTTTISAALGGVTGRVVLTSALRPCSRSWSPRPTRALPRGRPSHSPPPAPSPMARRRI